MSDERFRPYFAVYLMLISGNKILLARRYNTGWKDGFYGVAQGHLNGGESVTHAMVREAKEEIGISVDTKDLKVVHVMHRKSEDPVNQAIKNYQKGIFFSEFGWK